MSRPIRVILIDDHSQVHRAIAAAIDYWDDLELVAQGATGQEAIQLCQEYQPDVVLMDVMMPGMTGAEATATILKQQPTLKILAHSSFQDRESIQAMLDAGSYGYVLKNASIDDLANTIRTTHAGHSVFSAEVTQVLLRPSSIISPKEYGLTPREIEVLRCMVSGLNNRKIATSLSVSQSTAKFHVSNILTKLNVNNRVEAVALASEQNLLS